MRVNHFRRYRGFYRGAVLNALAYKINIYGWLFQGIMTLLAGILLWVAIYSEHPGETINGFSLALMVEYLLMCQVGPTIGMGADQSFGIVSEDIYKGEIATSLTKPVNYRFKCYVMSLGNASATFVILFVPLFLIAWLIIVYGFGNAWFTWYNFLLFLLASFFALTINDSFDFLFGEMTFYTQSYFGLMVIKDTLFGLLSGSLIPFSFFPSWASNILSYLPFASLVSTPVNILIGRYDLKSSLFFLLLSFGYASLLFLISYYSNKKMMKRVTSVGG